MIGKIDQNTYFLNTSLDLYVNICSVRLMSKKNNKLQKIISVEGKYRTPHGTSIEEHLKLA